MRKLAVVILLALALLASPAAAQLTPNNLGQTTLPAQSVTGNALSVPGTPNAIPFSQLASSLILNTGITALTGDVTATGPGPSAATIAANAVTNAKLATATQNTVKGAATSTAEADLTMTSCSATGSALKWTTNTGFGCQTTLADLGAADQTLSGGANVTQLGLSTGNVTIDCGARSLQSITNGGAFTITAPASDGSCMVLVTNNGSAGTISFSGFSVGANTGDALTIINTNKFTIFIWRINGISGYRVAAHQ
jgi:hypothetical protein